MSNYDWGFINFILLCLMLLWLFFKIIIRGKDLALWEGIVYIILFLWFFCGAMIREGFSNVFSV